MKTFTEFKKHLQETKASKEYKATDLDKQITQEIDAVKEAGDNDSLTKLEAIRDEKDKEVKESRFKIYMNQKDESDAEDDPDADSVQEEKEANAENCSDLDPKEKRKERQLDMKKMRERK